MPSEVRRARHEQCICISKLCLSLTCWLAGRDQKACKPGSVRPLRGLAAIPLGRSLLTASRDTPGARVSDNPCVPPTWSCSGRGLPCQPCCQACGGLLPHPFTLSPGPLLLSQAGGFEVVCFLWHFPSACAGRPLAVALSFWSPDFPPVCRYLHTSGCPAFWSRDRSIGPRGSKRKGRSYQVSAQAGARAIVGDRQHGGRLAGPAVMKAVRPDRPQPARHGMRPCRLRAGQMRAAGELRTRRPLRPERGVAGCGHPLCL